MKVTKRYYLAVYKRKITFKTAGIKNRESKATVGEKEILFGCEQTNNM